MSSTGLEVFDETVRKTNEWLNMIESRLKIENKQEAYRALRAVLHTVRDQIGPNENAQLAAQLPMLIRGLYFEGWRPIERTPIRTALDFENAVYANHGARPYKNAQEMISAVTDAMAAHIEPTELEQAFGRLTEPVRELLRRTRMFA